MCVRVIAKAETFGRKGDWNVDPKFLTSLTKYMEENDRGYADCCHSEFLDEVLTALYDTGFLKIADGGAAKI